MKFLWLLNSFYENTFWWLWKFVIFIQQNLEKVLDSLMASQYFYLYIPLFVLWLGFFETVWIVGFFVPLEIISISVFAYLHSHLQLFLFSVLFFSVSLFSWLVVWYVIWRKYYSKILNFAQKKFPALKGYFKEIDEYFDKYHFLAFPLVINIWWTRPIMALHLWGRWYDYRKFIVWSILATLSYVIPRCAIWYLVGVFWKIILQYFKIWSKYVFFWLLILIVISIVIDIFVWEKELEKK